jgi:hypothetical protein
LSTSWLNISSSPYPAQPSHLELPFRAEQLVI